MRNDNWIGSLEANFSFAKNLYFYASELSTISSLSCVFVYLYFYLYLYYHQERKPWYWCFLGARADLLDIRPNSTYSTLCHSCLSTFVIVNKYVFVLVVVCICICTSCQLLGCFRIDPPDSAVGIYLYFFPGFYLSFCVLEVEPLYVLYASWRPSTGLPAGLTPDPLR